MLSALRVVVSVALEPAFIEVKAVLIAYLIVSGSLWAAAILGVGLLFILGVVNGIAYFEGAKSLWSIYWLIRKSKPGAIQVAEIIPNEVLIAKYGYAHAALRIGRYAQNAGSMKMLYDSSGRTIDYQCAFNMFGNSYLFTASGLPMAEMPLFQRYLTLHEIGHGSMMGGIIRIRGKWLIASAIIACTFAVAVINVSGLGIAALALTIFIAFVFSRKVVGESHAEKFADGYALAHIARQDPASAVALIRKLLTRIADIDAFSSRTTVSSMRPALAISVGTCFFSDERPHLTD